VRVEPAPAGCATVVAELGTEDAGAWELASWGETRVRIDGGAQRAVPASGAVLGEGAELEIPPGARVEVETCSAGDPPRWGYYLVQRGSDAQHRGALDAPLP